MIEQTSQRIRAIFIERRSFRLPELAVLLGTSVARLASGFNSGELVATESGGEIVVPWNEAASIALETWSFAQIFEALAEDAATVLPPLLRPTEFTTVLPLFEVRMLEVFAREQQIDVSVLLERHLLDLASSADQGLLERESSPLR